MLIEGIHELLIKEEKSIPDVLHEELGRGYAQTILDQVVSPRESESIISPHNATKCVRAAWYKARKTVKPPLEPRARLTFITGSLLEHTYRFLCKAAGADLIGGGQEIQVQIGTEKYRGFLDDIIKSKKTGQKLLLEFKSMSGFSFKRFVKDGMDDAFGYLGQVHLYMRQALRDKLIDPPGWTILMGINKDTAHVHEELIKYDEFYAAKADENQKRLTDCLTTNVVPLRPYPLSKGNVLPVQCAYCDYKWSCYGREEITGYHKNEADHFVPDTKELGLSLSYDSDRWGGVKPVFKALYV